MAGPRAAVLAAAALLLAACASGGAGSGRGDRDLELPVEVRLGETHRLLRVLDGETGGPVPGVRVTAYEESPHAMPGAWSPAAVSAVGGPGWVLLPWEGAAEKASWFYVEAPGYGPEGAFGLPDVVRLRKGRDVEVLVLDPFDRPLAGASVEYFLGCGHTPDVQRFVTGPDGKGRLRCVTPNEGHLWVRAEGVAGYEFLDRDLVGDGPFTIRCTPAPTVEGTVVDHLGRPVAGAAVGTYDLHRGPWTRTDAAGRWRLVGAKFMDGLVVETTEHAVGGGERVPSQSFKAWPGIPRTVHMNEDPYEGEEPLGEKARLDVEAFARAEGKPYGNVDVWCVRASDGFVEEATTEENGVAEIEVPTGEYRVFAGDLCGMFRRAEARATAGRDARVRVELEGNGRCRPVLPNERERIPYLVIRPPWTGDCTIVTAERVEPARIAPGRDGEIFVPATGPFLLRYEEDGREARALVEGAPPAEGPTLTLDPPTPPPSARVEVAVEDVPVRVLLPDGSPALGLDLACGEEAWRLGEEGNADVPALPGARVRVSREKDPSLAPLEAILAGPGPVTLRWPDTRVEVRVGDAAGEALDAFELLVDGREVPGRWGVAVIRGLAPGAHDLLVAAAGRRARVVGFDLRDGERQTVEVRLRTAGAAAR